MNVEAVRDGRHDFDFLHGSWRIANERLISRLTDSDTWETFPAEGACRPVLGGLGNVDDFRPHRPEHPGFEGMSLRLFDPVSRLWSIFWADNASGRLLPPVVGAFQDGVGEFFGDDQHEGTPVRVRFRWSRITPASARWEQAFSADGGANWETNWTMAFSRHKEDV